MVKKISGKKVSTDKVGDVKSLTETSEIAKTEGVKGVKEVAPTSSVGGIGRASSVGRRNPTRIMTPAERAELMRAIDEESEKLVSAGAISKEKQELIRNAVKMTVDAGSLEEDDTGK